MRTAIRISLTLIFLFGFPRLVSAADANYLLKNFVLLDPAHKTSQKAEIWIQKGVIKSLKPNAAPKNFRGKIFDLSGRFIVPGFTDMHDHSTLGNPGPGSVRETLTTNDVAKRMLYNGVTAFLDLFGEEKALFAYRAARHPEGARLYAAGPMMTCTDGHGTDLGMPTRTMDTPEQARIQVRELAKEKPDVIKIAYDHARNYKSLDRPTMAAIISEAKKLGFRTVVHIGTWQDAAEAVDAGATIITHLYESDIPDSLVKSMVAHKIWEIPTMTYQQDLLNILENRSLLNSPLLERSITKELMQSYRTMNPNGPFTQRMLLWQIKGRDNYYRTLKKLFDAGIPLMTGTDSGDIGVFQGYSVHREMAMFAKAGIDNWSVLQAATSLPKKFFKRPLGINVGDKADLVVLKASPLNDIENTQTIEWVFMDGKLVDREALAVSK